MPTDEFLPNVNVQTWSTRDLNLAAALVVHGYEVISVDFQYEGKKNMPVGYFIFMESPARIQFEKDFLARKILVEPMLYSMAIRTLKSRVVGVGSNPRN